MLHDMAKLNSKFIWKEPQNVNTIVFSNDGTLYICSGEYLLGVEIDLHSPKLFRFSRVEISKINSKPMTSKNRTTLDNWIENNSDNNPIVSLRQMYPLLSCDYSSPIVSLLIGNTILLINKEEKDDTEIIAQPKITLQYTGYSVLCNLTQCIQQYSSKYNIDMTSIHYHYWFPHPIQYQNQPFLVLFIISSDDCTLWLIHILCKEMIILLGGRIACHDLFLEHSSPSDAHINILSSSYEPYSRLEELNLTLFMSINATITTIQLHVNNHTLSTSLVHANSNTPPSVTKKKKYVTFQNMIDMTIQNTVTLPSYGLNISTWCHISSSTYLIVCVNMDIYLVNTHTMSIILLPRHHTSHIISCHYRLINIHTHTHTTNSHSAEQYYQDDSIPPHKHTIQIDNHDLSSYLFITTDYEGNIYHWSISLPLSLPLSSPESSTNDDQTVNIPTTDNITKNNSNTTNNYLYQHLSTPIQVTVHHKYTTTTTNSSSSSSLIHIITNPIYPLITYQFLVQYPQQAITKHVQTNINLTHLHMKLEILSNNYQQNSSWFQDIKSIYPIIRDLFYQHIHAKYRHMSLIDVTLMICHCLDIQSETTKKETIKHLNVFTYAHSRSMPRAMLDPSLVHVYFPKTIESFIMILFFILCHLNNTDSNQSLLTPSSSTINSNPTTPIIPMEYSTTHLSLTDLFHMIPFYDMTPLVPTSSSNTQGEQEHNDLTDTTTTITTTATSNMIISSLTSISEAILLNIALDENMRKQKKFTLQVLHHILLGPSQYMQYKRPSEWATTEFQSTLPANIRIVILAIHVLDSLNSLLAYIHRIHKSISLSASSSSSSSSSSSGHDSSPAYKTEDTLSERERVTITRMILFLEYYITLTNDSITKEVITLLITQTLEILQTDSTTTTTNLSLHDICPLCQQGIEYSPHMPLSGYCHHCQVEYERCCATFQLIDLLSDTNNILRCTLCSSLILYPKMRKFSSNISHDGSQCAPIRVLDSTDDSLKSLSTTHIPYIWNMSCHLSKMCPFCMVNMNAVT